jgi:hypothetical protein
MLQEIIDYYGDEEFLIADGFDDAVIGVEVPSMRLIYSVTLCLGIIMTDEEMSLEDAIEHFEYNVSGAYVGEQTPIWCHDNYLL